MTTFERTLNTDTKLKEHGQRLWVRPWVTKGVCVGGPAEPLGCYMAQNLCQYTLTYAYSSDIAIRLQVYIRLSQARSPNNV